jgi:hypothetical protein
MPVLRCNPASRPVSIAWFRLNRAPDEFCLSFSSPDLSNSAREAHALCVESTHFLNQSPAFSLKIVAARLMLDIMRL